MINRKVVLILVVLLLLGLSSVPIVRLEAQTMGLYFDLDGIRMTESPPVFTYFDAYIFIHNADYYITAVEYQLQTPDDPTHAFFIITAVDYPHDETVTIGDPFYGHSMAFWPPLNGYDPGYNFICKLTCIITEPCIKDGGSIWDYPLVIGPHPDSGELRGTFYPDNEFFDITGLWSYLCSSHWAPYIYDVAVVGPRGIDVFFSPCADEWTGNNPDRYRVWNAADPSDTLDVIRAVRHFNGSDAVALFFDRPMTDGVDYVVWANVCCECHGCGESEFQYTYDEGSLPLLPDLAAAGISGYHDIRALCAPYDFSITVENWGLAPAGSFRVLVSIYSWQSGEYIELPIDSLYYTGLGIGETLTGDVNVVLPPEIKTYNYLRVMADDLEQVSELSEHNNLEEVTVWQYAPKILSITDVLEDCGGWVIIDFSRSYADRPDFSEVTEYEILRRVDPPPGGMLSGYTGGKERSETGQRLQRDPIPSGGCKEVLFNGDWELVGQVTADCSETYTTDVPTEADSTEEYGIYWSVFKVRAVRPTQDTTFHYVSCPDSGYSVVDGEPIAALLESYSAEFKVSGIEITWRLHEVDAGAVFHVLRSAGGNETFMELQGISIFRDGLSYKLNDSNVDPSEVYRYRVEYSIGKNRRTLFETGPVMVPGLQLTLYQNIPNPFNPVTSIKYYLPEAAGVILEIFDASGRRVCGLVDRYQGKGTYSVEWTGLDGGGGPAASGVYFYRLKAGKNVISRKMILLR